MSLPPRDGQLEKLHHWMVWRRWLLVGSLWFVLMPLSLWRVWDEVQLLREHFTWVGLRYAIAYNPAPAVGLSLCIGMTASTLVWQSRNILWGLPVRERQRLQRQLTQLEESGHFPDFWEWLRR